LLDTEMLSYLINFVYIIVVFIFSFYSQKIQVNLALGKISKSLVKLRKMRDTAKNEALSAIKKLGKPEFDPRGRFEELLQFFSVPPNRMDPQGVVRKLEHVVDSSDLRLRQELKTLAPSADERQIQNLQNLVETARELNSLYRTVRHHYLSGKKGGTIYSTMQIQMELPTIMEEAEAYYAFIEAFKQGKPIGDGVGPLAAAGLMGDAERRMVAEDTVAAELEVEGRKVVVLKAQGPGGTVGKLGDAVTKLLEEHAGKVSLVVMVDAGLKLEGEDSGFIVEGVGAAIGGVGVEKFKIEEAAAKYGVPVYALVVRQSLKEVLSPMTSAIRGAVEEALSRLGRVVRERTKPGDILMVVGVGNTIGVV